MYSCLLFGILTDVITGLWIYFGRSLPFKTLAFAMFFPALLSCLFVDDIKEFTLQVTGIHQLAISIRYSFLGGLISVTVVAVCAVLVVCLGLGFRTNFKDDGHNKAFLPGFIRAAGEEIGWRCFMLPCLMSIYSPTVALLISGIIWGFFHVPILILLTNKLHPTRPTLTVIVQCVACMLSAFPHGWVAIKSGYSFWASTMMHAIWNRCNPAILGSIYTQEPGYIEGEQWLINGEGFVGCLVLLPVTAFVIMDLTN